MAQVQEQEKEEQLHLRKQAIFRIVSDANDMNSNDDRERRIVPVPQKVTITNPTPAGE